MTTVTVPHPSPNLIALDKALSVFDGYTGLVYRNREVSFTVSSDSDVELATSIVNGHDCDIRHFEYAIWKFLPNTPKWAFSDSPVTIDFITGLDRRLHPIYTFNKGRLTKTDYYNVELVNDIEVRELVVTEFNEYVDDSEAIVISRTKTIKWYGNTFVNGEASSWEHGPDIKVMEKVYSFQERLVEGVRRRQNIIGDVKAILLQHLVIHFADMQQALSTSKEYFQSVSKEVYDYTEVNSDSLQSAITACEEPWMSEAVKEQLITTLNYVI
jgi:uncharacterized phage-associated protein